MEKKKDTYYFDPKIMNNFKYDLFFDDLDIKNIKKNKKLMMTDKGVYSISRPLHAKWITKCIKETVGNCNELVITDATAGLGGNTLNFAKNFKKVNAVEINDIHFKVLKNNIESFQYKNIELFHENYLNIGIENINEDIVFIDPPWGGKKYHTIKYFNIRLGKVPIFKVINLLRCKGTNYVVLKAPYNTNVTNLLRDVFYDNCKIYKKKHIWLLIFY